MLAGRGPPTPLSALTLTAHVLSVRGAARLLVLPIAIVPILIEPRALRRFAVAIAGVLLTTVVAGHPVFALLIFMSFLIGHVILPSTSARWRTPRGRLAERLAPAGML
jgi:hypothetical protein